MTKPLYIPKNKRWKGLTVFCYTCKTNVSEICKQTGKSLEKCPNGDKHVFKIYSHVAGTKNERRTKKLNTRDVNQAIIEAMVFEREVKENKQVQQKIKKEEIRNVKDATGIPFLLIHAMSRYIGFLNNENVPTFRQKERSKNHIKDVERAFILFPIASKKINVDLSSMSPNDIDDKFVGAVYDIINEKGFASRTFNKYFSYYTSFLKWYNDEYKTTIPNWFEKVNRREILSNPDSIKKTEFDHEKFSPLLTLSVMTVQVASGGK